MTDGDQRRVIVDEKEGPLRPSPFSLHQTEDSLEVVSKEKNCYKYLLHFKLFLENLRIKKLALILTIIYTKVSLGS